MRGKRVRSHSRLLPGRSIPARAGETAHDQKIQENSTVHPRACGETPTTSRLTSHETVHPRACGGNLVGMSGSSGVTGPSPRVRGKHVLRHEAVVPERSIPARAGETRTTQTSRLLPQVHPRACGGNYEELSEGTGEPGPSPRVRRKPGTEGTGRRAEGSIPARAGETDANVNLLITLTVHPRACGGNAELVWERFGDDGPSPRVRGKPCRAWRTSGRRGSIPARAGETGRVSDVVDGAAVHPRACGGNVCVPIHPTRLTGPSPRVRGKHGVDTEGTSRTRSIPARAGETTASNG